MQGIPLIGLALARYGPARLSMRARAQLVGISGATWIGITGLAAWQALRGQSVIAPDSPTLVAVIGLLAAALLFAAAVVLARPEGSSAPSTI